MRVLVFPDTHGRRYDLILTQEIENVDKVVFLGDYWDSFDISFKNQFSVMRTIVDFKRSFPDKIELLLGNHDVQYLYTPQYRCTGYQEEPVIPLFMQENKDLFDYAYAYDDYLFCHAGVSQTWLETVLYKYNMHWPNTAESYAELLNWEFQEIFWIGKDHKGSDPIDGPLWIRPQKLVEDQPHGITQVVGHTYSPWGMYFHELHVIDRGIPSVYNI